MQKPASNPYFAAIRASALLAGVLTCISPAQAHTLVANTSDNPIHAPFDNQGWWSTAITNSQPSDNYTTGASSFGTDSMRSFFSFYIPHTHGTVISARLQIQRYLQDGDVTLDLFDVSTPVAALTSPTAGVFNPAIFNDLGSGVSYGSYFIPLDDPTSDIQLELNAAAIQQINASLDGGYFSIGAALLNGGTIFGGSGFGNRFDGSDHQRLILSFIPEPASLALLGIGMLGLAGIRQKRRAG